MDRKKREDQILSRKLQHSRKEGLVSKVDQTVVMEAIQQEGPEVMTAAGQGWWDDMARRHPHIMLNGRIPSGESLNGRYGRKGKVSRRFVNGTRQIWDEGFGGWVEEPIESERYPRLSRELKEAAEQNS